MGNPYSNDLLRLALSDIHLNTKAVQDALIRAANRIEILEAENSNLYAKQAESEAEITMLGEKIIEARNQLREVGDAGNPNVVTDAVVKPKPAFPHFLTDNGDWLSNVIREVDGKHDLGAGALAEALVARIARELSKE